MMTIRDGICDMILRSETKYRRCRIAILGVILIRIEVFLFALDLLIRARNCQWWNKCNHFNDDDDDATTADFGFLHCQPSTLPLRVPKQSGKERHHHRTHLYPPAAATDCRTVSASFSYRYGSGIVSNKGPWIHRC